jgi:6-phosphogluconolactonase (cycloisomerase 2 family)
LNSSTGALTAVTGSPFSVSDILTALAEDPAGKYLYAIVPAPSNFDNGSVLAFSIDGSSGNLTPVNGSFTTGEVPVAASVNPAGTLLYVANSDSNDVSGFTITPASGALTPVTGSPFSTGASEDAHSVTIDPSGAFVYVANEATQDVTVFGVNGTTGALTPVQGSPFMSGGNGPIASAVDPSGSFLYVANRASGTVSGFTVSNTGALTAIAGSPFAAGTEPFAIALATPK